MGNLINSPYSINDLWQYDPSVTINWSTGSALQSVAVSASGSYSVNITNSAGCSASAVQSVSLSPNPTISVTGGTSILCGGSSSTLSASGANTYTWSSNAGSSNSSSVIVTPSVSTSYTLSGTTGTCTVNYPVSVNVIPTPVANITPVGSATVCGTAITLSTSVTANVWTQKIGLNSSRAFGTGFSIGSKGYLGLGSVGSSTYFSDFWEYDPATNAWTQKANFGGGLRVSAVGFTIGSKGYVGTGFNSSGLNLNDLWEFDPAANTWTQKANFGGTARRYATGFAVGTKGYIGLGNDGSAKSDLWEYDPSTNFWTQKASMGTARYASFGVSMGTKGYVGAGYISGSTSEFWEYDPTTNFWTQKANIGTSLGRTYAMAFALGSRIYATGGASIVDFWEYNPTTNAWVQKANFGGAYRSAGVAFAIGGKGYVGTGNGTTTYNDFWEYDPGATILWSTGATTSTISVTASGTYSLTLTNTSGCSSSTTQAVSITPIPTITVTGASAICNGSTLGLTAGGAASYTWSANAGNATTSTVNVTPASNTAYTVTGATNGCTATAVKAVTVNAIPVVTGSASVNPVCQGAPLTLTGGGAATYIWSGGAVNNVASPATSSADYTVTGTSAGNCTNTAVVSVTVKPSPAVTVNSGSICAGQSFTMVPNGAVSYTYSNGSAVVSPGSTTSYTVTGSNAIGCTNSAVSTVTVNALPVINAGNGLVCSGNSYTINPSGAATYTYSGGSNVVTPAVTSTYAIAGTSSVGCVSSASAVITVTVSALPTITVNSGSVCNGQSFTLTPGGAVTYTYLPGGSNVVSPTSNTSYSVSGANAFGCVSAAPAVANVTVLVSPTVTVNSGSICAGQSFTMVPNGAVSYTYSGGSAVVSPGSTASYTVTGVNAIGCPNAVPAVATVTVNAVPVISANSGVLCSGNAYTIVPSGAATYTYSGGSNVVTPAVTTTYSISGTSSLGCVSSASAVITVTVSALPTITVNSGTICSGHSFTINATGANTYTYLPGGSSIVTPPANTSYSVTGANALGCVSAAQAIADVTVFTTPTVSLPPNAVICTGNSYTINPVGAASYTYSGGSNVVTPNNVTTYTVTGLSLQGCYSTPAVITVSVQPSLSVTISGPTVTCAGSPVVLTGNGAGTYTWSTGAIDYSISVNPTTGTLYSVNAGSGNCAGSATRSVAVNQLPVITTASSNATLCVGETGTIIASGADSYIWNEGGGFPLIVISPTVTTSYTVTGTSSFGCVGTAVATQPVTDCTGIAEAGNQNSAAIHVYPNPNNGVVNITSDAFPENTRIDLYNYTGQLIYSEKVNGNTAQLNYTNAANGIYALHVLYNGKPVFVTKLVKQ